MDSESRSCAHCGSEVGAADTACPSCGRHIRFDVYYVGPALSPADAYQRAKLYWAMLREKVPRSNVAELRRGFESSDCIVAKALHRTTAEQLFGGEPTDFEFRPHIPAKRLDWRTYAPAAGVAALVALGVGLGVGLASLDDAPDSAPADEWLIEGQIPSVVVLKCSASIGSGFFATPSIVVTNHHVLCGGSDAIDVILSDGTELPGTVEGSLEELDLAVVRVSQEQKPLALGDSATLRATQEIFAIGAPLGLDFSVTQGMVSHPGRKIQDQVWIQVDAAINQGNSGGPLLNAQGQVVGIITRRARGDGLGLAVPVNYLFDGDETLLPPPDGYDGSGWARLLESSTETVAERMQHEVEAAEAEKNERRRRRRESSQSDIRAAARASWEKATRDNLREQVTQYMDAPIVSSAHYIRAYPPRRPAGISLQLIALDTTAPPKRQLLYWSAGGRKCKFTASVRWYKTSKDDDLWRSVVTELGRRYHKRYSGQARVDWRSCFDPDGEVFVGSENGALGTAVMLNGSGW